MHNSKPVTATLAQMEQAKWERTDEMTARLVLSAGARNVAVMRRWTESYPSGNSVTYATVLQDVDGKAIADRGWHQRVGVPATVREFCEQLDARRKTGPVSEPLDWFVR